MCQLAPRPRRYVALRCRRARCPLEPGRREVPAYSCELGQLLRGHLLAAGDLGSAKDSHVPAHWPRYASAERCAHLTTVIARGTRRRSTATSAGIPRRAREPLLRLLHFCWVRRCEHTPLRVLHERCAACNRRNGLPYARHSRGTDRNWGAQGFVFGRVRFGVARAKILCPTRTSTPAH